MTTLSLFANERRRRAAAQALLISLSSTATLLALSLCLHIPWPGLTSASYQAYVVAWSPSVVMLLAAALILMWPALAHFLKARFLPAGRLPAHPSSSSSQPSLQAGSAGQTRMQRRRHAWTSRIVVAGALFCGISSGYLGAVCLGLAVESGRVASYLAEYSNFTNSGLLAPKQGEDESAWRKKHEDGHLPSAGFLLASARAQDCPSILRRVDRLTRDAMTYSESVVYVLAKSAAQSAWAAGCMDETDLFHRTNAIAAATVAPRYKTPAWHYLLAVPRSFYSKSEVPGNGLLVFPVVDYDRAVMQLAKVRKQDWCILQGMRVSHDADRVSRYCHAIADPKQAVTRPQDFRLPPGAMG